MESNLVPPEPVVRDNGQPAEDDSAATTLTVDVAVESNGEADGGSDSPRYVPL